MASRSLYLLFNHSPPMRSTMYPGNASERVQYPSRSSLVSPLA